MATCDRNESTRSIKARFQIADKFDYKKMK